MLFAKVLAIPRVASYVDPALAGDAHDGAWVVEATLDTRPVGCILDGTVRVAADHARWLDALAYRLPSVPTIAVASRTRDGAPPPLDAWMTRWPDPQEVTTGAPAIAIAYVEDPSDADNLTRLAAHDDLRDTAVLVIVAAAASPLVTPAAIAALHARMPELRPVVLVTEPPPAPLLAALAAAGGACLQLHAMPTGTPKSEVAWTDVELDFAPGPDVGLAVHAPGAEQRGDAIHVRRPQVLRASDTVRVDAITTAVDAPVFTVALRALRTDLPLSCHALHVARRIAAQLPSEPLVASAIEDNRIVVPACDGVTLDRPHDLWVDGAIAFEVAGTVHRTRLLPAMRIATPTAAVELRVLRGQVYVQPHTGDVLCDGIRLAREQRLEPYRMLVLDDVRASFAINAAWPDEHPEVVIEGDVERYPGLMTLDGIAIELRRRARGDELWCEGRPLALHGTTCHPHGDEPVAADAADLSWLLHAARTGTLEAHTRAPLVLAEQHGISARLTIDLETARATFVVFGRH